MEGEVFFKRNRKAKIAKLTRLKATRKSYEKILIVCEGSKTEPLYFEELVDFYKIHSANVKVCGDCDSDPLSVVDHGLALYQKEKKASDGPFDRVYFVIDKDTHDNYSKALDKIINSHPKGAFYAANSVPCFEYWLLLHFSYSTKPYIAYGNKSIGMAVIEDLKRFWPGYTKAEYGSFKKTIETRNDSLAYAKANARRSLKHSHITSSDNPSTQIHDLVDYLQHLKSH